MLRTGWLAAGLGVSTALVVSHPLEGARNVLPLAWSRDARQVAYETRAEPTNPYSGTQLAGDLHVLDLRSGESRPVPRPGEVSAAGFSPDSRRLAVQGTTGLSVVDLDKRRVSHPRWLRCPRRLHG